MDATKKISYLVFPDGDVGKPQVTRSTPGKGAMYGDYDHALQETPKFPPMH